MRDHDASYAFELGRAGEPMPDWVRESSRFREAYLDGVPVRGRGDGDASGGDEDGGRGGAGRATDAPGTGGTSRRSSSTPALSLPSPTLRPPSRLSVADGSGFALGLVLFAIGSAYWRYGPAGVRSWFTAKFLNKVDPQIAAAEAARGIIPKGGTAA